MFRLVVIWLLVIGILLLPTSALAGDSVNIAVLVTGGEDILDITNVSDNYSFGSVHISDNKSTGLDYFLLTNVGNVDLDISIYGEDLTGGLVTWTLSDLAVPDSATYGMKAGSEGGSYSIVIKKTESYNLLKGDLGVSENVSWGFEAYFPTSNLGNESMSGKITLLASKNT